MKKFIPWVAFGVSALGVCGFFFYLAGEPEKVGGQLKPVEKVAASTETAPSLSPNSSSFQKPEMPTPASPQQVTPKEAAIPEKQRIFEAIEEAAITYNAAQLPKIQPFLVHPDPQIRAAAVQGMVTLGDAAAGPMLRQAARLAPYAKEAAAMEEAADYVELPSASMLPKNRRKR